MKLFGVISITRHALGEFFRKLASWNPRLARIDFNSQYFDIVDFRRKTHQFRAEDIIEIKFQKMDKFSYDEIFVYIIYKNSSGEMVGVEIEEGALNFAKFIDHVSALSGFDRHLVDKINKSPPNNEYKTVFKCMV